MKSDFSGEDMKTGVLCQMMAGSTSGIQRRKMY